MVTAFTSAQRSAIQQQTLTNRDNHYGDGNDTLDEVFLLAPSEVCDEDAPALGFAESFWGNDEGRCAHVSDFAYAMGRLRTTYNDRQPDSGGWWLRSPGANAYYASSVDALGYVDRLSAYHVVDDGGYGVRPALRVSLSSNQVSYAGIVCSDGSDTEVGGSDGVSGGTDTSVSRKSTEFFVSQADSGKQDVTLNFNWGWSMLLGDATKTGFSDDLAVAGLLLSGATEHSQGRAESLMKTMGFDKRSSTGYGGNGLFLNPAATFGYKRVVSGDKARNVFAVAVRGTSAFSDILTDACSVNDGFRTSAANARSDLEIFMTTATHKTLDALKGEDNVFFLTGHSLGGAIVNHMALDLSAYAGNDSIFAYTFATPKTTTEPVRNGNVFNVVSKSDIVPDVPPTVSLRNGDDVEWWPAWDNAAYTTAFMKLTGKEWAVQSSLAGNYNPFSVNVATPRARALLSRTLNNHLAETYMAYLMSRHDASYKSPASPLAAVRVLCVRCPVDVEVRYGGEVIGRVAGNELDSSQGLAVPMFVDGDVKYALLPSDAHFDVRLTGTDAGSMACTLTEENLSTGEVVTVASYDGVALENGKAMSLEVPQAASVAGVDLLVTDSVGRATARVGEDGAETDVGSLLGAKVSAKGGAYTGKKLKPSVSVKVGKKKLRRGVDYVVTFLDADGVAIEASRVRDAGTYQIVVAGRGAYAQGASATFKIAKAANPMTAKAAKKSYPVKASKLKKAAQKVKAPVTVKKAQGEVAYANASKKKALKAFKVDAKNGTVTVPKKTKAGTYKVAVKATAAGNGNYKSGSKKATVKVVVK